MHGPARKVSAEEKERGYQVMTTWDEYMAASAAEFQQQRQLRRMVVLAGSGHIDRGFGIPQCTVKRTGGKAVTVKIELGRTREQTPDDGVADFMIYVRDDSYADPRSGRLLVFSFVLVGEPPCGCLHGLLDGIAAGKE